VECREEEQTKALGRREGEKELVGAAQRLRKPRSPPCPFYRVGSSSIPIFELAGPRVCEKCTTVTMPFNRFLLRDHWIDITLLAHIVGGAASTATSATGDQAVRFRLLN